MEKEINILKITTAAQWRDWLAKNHHTTKPVWLKMQRKNSIKPGLLYEDAIDEALCYGWIDSTKRAWDENFSIQSFTPRKPKSVWSGINKNKVKRLIKDGKMEKPGHDSIKAAKANGYWTIMDDVEKMIIPDDLQAAFNSSPEAEDYFLGLSDSNKKLVLRWLVLAQREETRKQRIGVIVENAGEGRIPSQLA